MNWYSIIWCDEISYNMTSYASSMRSIAWLKWRKCWTIRQVVWKWYDDTSCDMISYHSRGRGCRRGRGLCSRCRCETFLENFTLKKWPSKIFKIYKKEPHENSVHFPYWIIPKWYGFVQVMTMSVFSIGYELSTYLIVPQTGLSCRGPGGEFKGW